MGRQFSIYADSRAPGTCRSCGAPIEWAELTTGRRMPFDRIVVLAEHARLFIGARDVLNVDADAGPTHFATCPDHAYWRKGKR
jgi:hypothetical protein